jgi:hypothetical protein
MRGQDLPAPVKSYAGTVLRPTEIEILDADVRTPRIVVLDRASLSVTREVPLKPPKRAIEPFGFVRDSGGAIVAIGDRGLRLVRYETESSVPTEELLAEQCTGVASLNGRLILTPTRSSGGHSLVAVLERGGLRPLGTLSSRAANTRQLGVIANLFACGAGLISELPCWHAADGREIYVLREDGRVRRVRVPNQAVKASGPSSGNRDDLFARFSYPIRDVFQVTGSLFWVLTNQEGALNPSQDGAVRSRHALLLDESGVVRQEFRLPKEGRALLSGTEKDVSIFFKDATVARYSR